MQQKYVPILFVHFLADDILNLLCCLCIYETYEKQSGVQVFSGSGHPCNSILTSAILSNASGEKLNLKGAVSDSLEVRKSRNPTLSHHYVHNLIFVSKNTLKHSLDEID